MIERGVPLEEIEGDFNVAVSARSQTGHNSGDESHGVDPCTGYVDDNGYVIDASDVAKILAAQQSTNDEATTPLTVGSTLFVDLPEDDISGDFTVTGIRPCPTPNSGDGCLVTTKFIHENAEILDLRIEGSADAIGTTASHPFWSEDRQDFVPAGELRIGEALLLADDSIRRVESFNRRENRETVYNIEVDGEHVFYVGEDGVLVHNSCTDHMHHSIPRAIQKRLRNARNKAAFDRDIIGRPGLPNRISVPAGTHRQIHSGRGYIQGGRIGGIGGGHYNNAFHRMIMSRGGYASITKTELLEIRDFLVRQFGL